MKKHRMSVLGLAIVAVTPAAAQTNETWPVDAQDNVCTTSRIGSATSDALLVSYDPASSEITLRTAIETSDTAPNAGTTALLVIFAKARSAENDIAWGYRQFAVRHADDQVDLTTRFAGKKNVDQILEDLGSSARLGLVQNERTVADFDLTGIAPAIARLKACASRVAAR